MFYSIKGILIHREPNLAVVECGGIGYKCMTTMATLSRLGSTGESVHLYTYLYVREDALDLFGFYDLSEMNCFKMLLGVSGVGPKVALGILSDLTPEKFALAVASNDVKLLTRGKGVGPKLAQRIVLELKDKMKSADIAAGMTELPSGFSMDAGNIGEALSALVVLGYSQSEASSILSGIDPELPVEAMIKQALRLLAGRK